MQTKDSSPQYYYRNYSNRRHAFLFHNTLLITLIEHAINMDVLVAIPEDVRLKYSNYMSTHPQNPLSLLYNFILPVPLFIDGLEWTLPLHALSISRISDLMGGPVALLRVAVFKLKCVNISSR